MSTIVITGCSSGFGLQAALAFARNGDKVYATMRNPERSKSLLAAAATENLNIHIKQLDVNKSDTYNAVFDEIIKESNTIDVLVNNAGILRAGAFEDLSETMIREVVETNLFAPLFLSKAVLPYMRKQKSGYIIMISSLSGIAGLPGDVAYTAAKFGLEGATEALRHEVDRWGIKMALVEAGMYATDIMSTSLPEESVLPDYYPTDSAYRALIETNLQGMRQRMPDALDPAIVGKLLVEIANSDGKQLRWPADEVATMVLEKMFAQTDAERDAFLRDVSGSDWWSAGKLSPDDK
ncbi:MAG: SDR family oxidoreductase [Gammaproteobacteria bacterium]|jgi:NAD(P)-dependent dehydrogenase (short-subunit alcohol dehydrogenase family)|nr:SDR family oxidoreductase [Gammaproteobacteria bacterium]